MRKLLNKLTCVALSLTCLMGCMATPAFAYSGGETGENVKAPSIFDYKYEDFELINYDPYPVIKAPVAV